MNKLLVSFLVQAVAEIIEAGLTRFRRRRVPPTLRSPEPPRRARQTILPPEMS